MMYVLYIHTHTILRTHMVFFLAPGGGIFCHLLHTCTIITANSSPRVNTQFTFLKKNFFSFLFFLGGGQPLVTYILPLFRHDAGYF